MSKNYVSKRLKTGTLISWLALVEVVPGYTDTLILVGCVCLQSRQLLQSGYVTEGSLLVMACSQGELHD